MRRGAPAARPVSLHVQHLELSGVALTPLDLRRFRSALGAELQRLAAQGGLGAAPAPARLPGVIAPPVRLGGSAAELGRDVARSLFAALRSRA